MPRLWKLITDRCRLLPAALLLVGCAAHQPPASPTNKQQPGSAPAPAAMVRAREQGETAFLPARDGVQIPVRIFGSHGRRRPVLMTHGLESHSGWFVQSGAFMAGLGHPV